MVAVGGIVSAEIARHFEHKELRPLIIASGTPSTIHVRKHFSKILTTLKVRSLDRAGPYRC